jgi:gliding motility-associated-like protein
MRTHSRYILNYLLATVTGVTLYCQNSLCPPNIDFENGSLDNWECKTGRVESIAGVNTVTWMNNGVNPLNHHIIPRATAGVDPYGNFSEASPNGSAYSVRLGNNYFQNISAEGMFYTFNIPDTAAVFSILFQYAVVFQDPQHNPDEQPRFRASIYNLTDNEVIDCANFDFTASASLPGFTISTVDPTVIYKDWTPVTINLSGLAGKTIRLEFITSDCTFRGHFGYAYIDVNSSCSGAITGNRVCADADEVSLVAPFGFQTYAWYADQTFSTILSSSQVLTVSPVPPAGTSFPVIVGPYPGFGCPDTISTTLKTIALPVANAGSDMSVCKNQFVQIGAVPVQGYGYSWTPASLLVNPATANPVTMLNLTDTTTFYLSVIDSITGCKNYDTVQVNPVSIDTALIVSGKTTFCKNEPVNTTLQLLVNDGNIQWFENNLAVTGATAGLFYPNPAETGIYWAVITKDICTASSRQVIITKRPVPEAAFSVGPAEQCLNGPVVLLNKTAEPAGINTSYTWQISDGRSFNSKNLTLSFNMPGRKDISLIAVTTDGCRDTAMQSYQVLEKCGVFVPTAFSPGEDGRNDLFRPIFLGAFKLKRFAVYERNGVLVFETKTVGEGWDGRIRGKMLTTSVLVWTLEYEDDNGKTVFQKGTVTLIR